MLSCWCLCCLACRDLGSSESVFYRGVGEAVFHNLFFTVLPFGTVSDLKMSFPNYLGNSCQPKYIKTKKLVQIESESVWTPLLLDVNISIFLCILGI